MCNISTSDHYKLFWIVFTSGRILHELLVLVVDDRRIVRCIVSCLFEAGNMTSAVVFFVGISNPYKSAC